MFSLVLRKLFSATLPSSIPTFDCEDKTCYTQKKISETRFEPKHPKFHSTDPLTVFYSHTQTAYKFKITSRYSSSNPWQTIAGFFVCPAEGWKKVISKNRLPASKIIVAALTISEQQEHLISKNRDPTTKNGNPSWII